ncbi:hypothetical protein RRG08_024666 [Elysia crispata]|uniref:Uncharacterized protein n=1 Tax=Elysia crispata TaxID=231223 RepID=A0AAE1DNY8_9GAST|nr:hypothetical protein RRG08_024665 [Elysia crispata]KAK3776895.1 hypothetical protein RRG08_024666 [Elysia crispata]
MVPGSTCSWIIETRVDVERSAAGKKKQLPCLSKDAAQHPLALRNPASITVMFAKLGHCQSGRHSLSLLF